MSDSVARRTYRAHEMDSDSLGKRAKLSECTSDGPKSDDLLKMYVDSFTAFQTREAAICCFLLVEVCSYRCNLTNMTAIFPPEAHNRPSSWLFFQPKPFAKSSMALIPTY